MRNRNQRSLRWSSLGIESVAIRPGVDFNQPFIEGNTFSPTSLQRSRAFGARVSVKLHFFAGVIDAVRQILADTRGNWGLEGVENVILGRRRGDNRGEIDGIPGLAPARSWISYSKVQIFGADASGRGQKNA